MPRRDPHEFFDILSSLVRRIRGVAAQSYATLEVGTVQAKILRHVGRESPISQADLARAIETAPTLTGRALDTLIERGWIRRTRSDEDRRQYLLELTASGQRTREKVEKARGELLDRIAAQLDERDVRDFERIANKILAVVDAPPVGHLGTE